MKLKHHDRYDYVPISGNRALTPLPPYEQVVASALEKLRR